jgi:cytidine deaminase
MYLWTSNAENRLRLEMGSSLVQLASSSYGSGHHFAAVGVGKVAGKPILVRGVNQKYEALGHGVCAETTVMNGFVQQGGILERMFLLGPRGAGESCGACLQLMTEYARLSGGLFPWKLPSANVQIDYFDSDGAWYQRRALDNLLPSPFLNERRKTLRQRLNDANLQADPIAPDTILTLLNQPSVPTELTSTEMPQYLARLANASGLEKRAVLAGLVTTDNQLFVGIRLHPGGAYTAPAVLTALAAKAAAGCVTPLAHLILLGGDDQPTVEINPARQLLRAHLMQNEDGDTWEDLPVDLYNRSGEMLESYTLATLPVMFDDDIHRFISIGLTQ